MSTRKARRRPKAPQVPSSPSLVERLEEERTRLFKGMSIIACCRLACVSRLTDGGDMEVMTDALQAANDLIDESAGELEVIGREGGAS